MRLTNDRYSTFFAIITAAGTIGTIISLFAKWFRWRKNQLRREEVLSWANDCIECLQTLVLISTFKNQILNADKINEIRLQTFFDTSILIERGRLFFKNEDVDNYGSEKLPAYRGYRPRILDHLVVAHKIARDWPDNSEDRILRRSALAEDCLKNFVSLAQKEVGRDRAASAEALKGGSGVHLPALMKKVHPKQKELIRKNYPNIFD